MNDPAITAFSQAAAEAAFIKSYAKIPRMQAHCRKPDGCLGTDCFPGSASAEVESRCSRYFVLGLILRTEQHAEGTSHEHFRIVLQNVLRFVFPYGIILLKGAAYVRVFRF